jgi:hypothetical protein
MYSCIDRRCAPCRDGPSREYIQTELAVWAGYREYIDHNNDEQHVHHEQYESNNIVLNEPFLDQALVTRVPTPEPRLLATLELPLASRSFSTDSRGAALEKMEPNAPVVTPISRAEVLQSISRWGEEWEQHLRNMLEPLVLKTSLRAFVKSVCEQGSVSFWHNRRNRSKPYIINDIVTHLRPNAPCVPLRARICNIRAPPCDPPTAADRQERQGRQEVKTPVPPLFAPSAADRQERQGVQTPHLPPFPPSAADRQKRQCCFDAPPCDPFDAADHQEVKRQRIRAASSLGS